MDDHLKHPVDEKKVRFRPNIIGSKKENIIWIVTITFISFILSASMLFISSEILEGITGITAFLVLLIIIFIGIIFDIIGIAVTAADETPFHAMASRKVYGVKRSIRLIRNANKVSSFCNDVIGDICGVISGTASVMIIAKIGFSKEGAENVLAGLIMSGIVAALTVGGKAIGKTFAIAHSNYIVYRVGVILQFVAGNRQKNKKSKKQKRS